MSVLGRAVRLGAAAALAMTATFAAPSSAQAVPTHVAIVVAGQGTACVGWHSGITGAEVLGARFDVTYGQRPPYTGLVLQIDGTPAAPDPQQAYWAYFHDDGKGWSYSGNGPATYYPKPGSVEGWRYDSAAGGDSNAAPPPAVSYASICGEQVPAPHTSSVPRPHSAARQSAPSTVPAPQSEAHHRGTVPTPGASASRSTARRSSAPAAHPTTSTTEPANIAVARRLSSAPPKSEPTSASSIPPWGTALALALVAVLGGAALWLARARRG